MKMVKCMALMNAGFPAKRYLYQGKDREIIEGKEYMVAEHVAKAPVFKLVEKKSGKVPSNKANKSK